MRIIVMVINLFFVLSCAAQDFPFPQWTYEGEIGPAYWGRIDKNFKMCNRGKKQSPIDIDLTDIEKPKSEKEISNENRLEKDGNSHQQSLEFKYQDFNPEVINNGHNVEVKVPPGNALIYENQKYHLTSIFLHTPSEHALDGKFSDFEIQLMHKNNKGEQLVVAFLVNKGKMNYALQPILRHVPLKQNNSQIVKNEKLNPMDFFPKQKQFYIYSGSLTQPPCTENVIWVVLSSPIQASLEQLHKLKLYYRINARPTQPLNGRELILR